ncbi:MAG TPA: TraB/GumN family protein [Saprospiraceae bacterium]|nr:TraB/GumN family protein [Saprospiraceae bacterium]
MKSKLSILYFLIAALDSFVYSQETNALLWKIESTKTKEVSYLFGTIHMIPEKDFFLPKGTEVALSQSQKIVLEVDLKEMTDAGQLFGLMNKLTMNSDTTISMLMSKEDYSLVTKKLEEIGLPIQFFERMKPMFLSSMLQAGDLGGTDEGNLKSYEFAFQDYADTTHKSIEGLESLEFQISIFDTIPYSIQAKALVSQLKNDEKEKDGFQKLIQFYQAQNLEALSSEIQNDDSELKPYLDLLLYKRNEKWIPKMETLMSQGSCFFAVGAGHLSGPKGVLQLLKNKSYKVSPVQ